MKKSVYSLVLMDDVVAAVDHEAYLKNTSRSNLINQLLAESMGLITPEMKMKDIFDHLESMLNDASAFQIRIQSSDSVLQIRTPLRYKYRPTARYDVELYRDPGDTAGQLRVSFRTSSTSFAETVEDFFTRWMYLESEELSDIHPEGVPAGFDAAGARYERGFVRDEEKELTEDDIAAAISQYIQTLDDCIKFYFENLGDEDSIVGHMNQTYKRYISSGVYIV